MSLKKKRTWKLLDWERQAIIDAYAEGESVAAIADEFGVHFSYPARIARRYGIPPRPRGGLRPKKRQLQETVLAV